LLYVSVLTNLVAFEVEVKKLMVSLEGMTKVMLIARLLELGGFILRSKCCSCSWA